MNKERYCSSAAAEVHNLGKPEKCPWVDWAVHSVLVTTVPLALSLLRVINVKIPLQPHKKYDITQYGELDFS